jgi:hypothetical protein
MEPPVCTGLSSMMLSAGLSSGMLSRGLSSGILSSGMYSISRVVMFDVI